MSDPHRANHATWADRWSEGKIGFHRGEVDPALRAHGASFLAGGPHRVLVPLCGKTVDLIWLAEAGHQVVGIELVPQAIESFHQEQGLQTRVDSLGPFKAHRSRVTLLEGDVFDAAPADLGTFDRIWDRAALVALPKPLRQPYVDVLRSLWEPGGSLLLVTLSYDTSKKDGPPFAVPDAEVRELFSRDEVTLLETHDISHEPKFAEAGPAVEQIWRVRRG